MNALSVRNRFEWALLGIAIGAIFFYITYYMYVTEGPSAGLACYFTGILGVFFIRQSIFAPPSITLNRWWWNKTSPGYYGIPWTGGAIRIIRANGPKSNIIFDLDGHCVGDEDYILGQWHFHPIDSDCRYRMPTIAYWLTKRQLPASAR
ncbi:MAG: hypothetical protein RLZZ480_542 [Candidatus Parcubacteria bacterium]|jgi:hypothetical protein